MYSSKSEELKQRKTVKWVSRIGAVIFALMTVFFTAVGCTGKATPQEEYLRIHIRANSNAEKDQAVKYAVRDEVVNFLTPLLSGVSERDKAQDLIEESLDKIVIIAEETLKENGFNYGARAGVKNEKFPTRKYEDITLSAGFYDALIIELGSGSGDNWWCVAYPPLCFSGSGENYVYKSKLAEVWGKIFG